MTVFEKSKDNTCWRGCGTKARRAYCWREEKPVEPSWKPVWRFLQQLKIELLYDAAIPLLGIHPKDMKSGFKEKNRPRKNELSWLLFWPLLCKLFGRYQKCSYPYIKYLFTFKTHYKKSKIADTKLVSFNTALYMHFGVLTEKWTLADYVAKLFEYSSGYKPVFVIHDGDF